MVSWYSKEIKDGENGCRRTCDIEKQRMTKVEVTGQSRPGTTSDSKYF